MISIYFFLFATILLSLNFIRISGLAISDWLYLIALALTFLETFSHERKKLYYWAKNPFIWPASLIAMGAILSTTRATNIPIALIEAFQQIYVSTVFISLTWIMVKRGYGGWIIKAFIFSGFLAASIALLDYLTGSNFGPILSGAPDKQWYYRYAGTLGHPNKLGYFLTLTSLLTLAKWGDIQKKLLTQSFWASILIVQVSGIILSGSVTAYIGLLSGIFISLVVSKQTRKKFLLLILPVSLLIGLTLIIFFIVGHPLVYKINAQDNIIVRSLNRVEDTTAEMRIIVYRQAVEEIIKSPIIGAGYDQISTSQIDSNSRLLSSSIHNSYLQIFYAGGALSFAGWFSIHFYFGWMALKTLLRKGTINNLTLVLCASIFAILLMDQFQDSVYPREKWLALGLCFSYLIAKIPHKT